MTVSEYFRKEADSRFYSHHQLLFGKIVTVPQPTSRQLELFANLCIHLGKALRKSAYQIQTDQVRFVIESQKCVLANGASINYGVPKYHAEDVFHNGFLEVEAIFDFPINSSKLHEYRQKWELLQGQDGLLCYALCFQDEARIQVHLRPTRGADWEIHELSPHSPKIELPLMEVSLHLHEIYYL